MIDLLSFFFLGLLKYGVEEELHEVFSDLEAKINRLLEYQEFITKHIDETLSQLIPILEPPHGG